MKGRLQRRERRGSTAARARFSPAPHTCGSAAPAQRPEPQSASISGSARGLCVPIQRHAAPPPFHGRSRQAAPEGATRPRQAPARPGAAFLRRPRWGEAGVGAGPPPPPPPRAAVSRGLCAAPLPSPPAPGASRPAVTQRPRRARPLARCRVGCPCPAPPPPLGGSRGLPAARRPPSPPPLT